MLDAMRSVWVALALILGGSLLGAFLLWRVVDETNHPTPLLAPRGARVLDERSAGSSTVVSWRIGGHAEEASSGVYGITIWQGKRRLYQHRAAPGTSDIHVETGRFGVDGRTYAVLLGDYDARTGCLMYRGLVTGAGWVRQRILRRLCGDRGSAHIRNGAMVIRTGNRTIEVRS
jgi:hypothetical protein